MSTAIRPPGGPSTVGAADVGSASDIESTVDAAGASAVDKAGATGAESASLTSRPPPRCWPVSTPVRSHASRPSSRW